MKKTLGILLSLSITCYSINAYAQTVAGGNGSFVNDFTGWNISSDTVQINTTAQDEDSKAVLIKNPVYMDTLSTTLGSLTIGESYKVSYYIARRGGNLYITDASETIIASGGFEGDLTTDTYYLHEILFTATETSHTLMFESKKRVFIDNISITLIPSFHT